MIRSRTRITERDVATILSRLADATDEKYRDDPRSSAREVAAEIAAALRGTAKEIVE